jgi:hypothetical protein
MATARPPSLECETRLITRRRTVGSVHEIDAREVLGCDESFFTALLAADHDLLGTILADDFLTIDVLSGQVTRREELLGAISSGQGSISGSRFRRGLQGCGQAVMRDHTQDRLQVIGRVGAELESDGYVPGSAGDDQLMEWP